MHFLLAQSERCEKCHEVRFYSSCLRDLHRGAGILLNVKTSILQRSKEENQNKLPLS